MSYALLKKDTLYLQTPQEVKQLAKKLQGYMEEQKGERIRKGFREDTIHGKILSPDKRSFLWVIAHTIPPDIASRLNASEVYHSTNVTDVFRDLTTEEWATITTMRENGSHSSRVFLRLTDEEWERVRFPVIIDWEEYVCDTLKDQAHLFEQFDADWSARDNEDKIGAHLANNDALYTHLNRYLMKAAISGLKWYAAKVEKNAAIVANPIEIMYSNHDVQPFLLWFGTTAQQRVTNHLFNPPVIAAMYHTTRRGSEDIKAFWREVARGYSALPEGTVEYKLSLFLSNMKNHHYDWKEIKRQMKDTQWRPNDLDIFGTCLRAVMTTIKGGTVDHIFAPAGKKNAAQIAQTIYPLPDPITVA